MATWDPSATATVGLRWLLTGESYTSLSTVSSCVAWYVASSATETISTMQLPLQWSGPDNGYGKLEVSVYNIADAGAGQTLTTTTYSPNADASASNIYNDSWGSISAGSVYSRVDDGSSYSDSDYIWFPNSSSVRWEFGTAAVSGQVTEISFDVRTFKLDGTTGVLYVDLYNHSTYVSRLATINPSRSGTDTTKPFDTTRIGPFTTNPNTGLAWTASEVAGFDTSGSGLKIVLSCSEGNGNVAVSWVRMLVTTGTDKRLAVFSTALQTSKPSGTSTSTTLTPAANWSKSSGTNYLLVARRIDDPTGVSPTIVPELLNLQGDDPPGTHGTPYSATIDSAGVLQTTGSAVTTWTQPFWLGTSGGAISADSEPYWDLKLKPVYTGVGNNRQDFNNATNTAYKGITLLVGKSGTPTADLSVSVWNSAHSVQQGGAATVATTDLTSSALVGTITDSTYGTVSLYRVLVQMASSATLAAATTYHFDFASSTSSGNPWLIVMADATASHALTGNQTYGTSTLTATAAGSSVAQGDFLVWLQSTITAPSGLTAVATNTTINSTTLQYADIDWTNGATLGASWSRHEIQRSEDGGTTYVEIGRITSSESTQTFADYEAPRGTACKYRVRHVRTDGAVSDWTTLSGTCTLTGTTGLTVFTSNASPSLTVGFYVSGDLAQYQFLTGAQTVYHQLHDRDYQVAFKPLEQRGIQWAFDVNVHGGPSAPSAGEGMQAFTKLRSLAESTTATTVCMITGDNERFFGTLDFTAGNRIGSAKVYRGALMFTQTTADATSVTV
jgi:hypothetical protein